MERVCANCGMPIFNNEPRFRCRDNYLISKYFDDEWRRTCSTEEFAEELAKVVLDLVSWNNDPKPSEVRNILKSWLKHPHKPNS